MNKYLALVPLMAINLTGCGTIDTMNCLLQESTVSIQANSQAIDRSTEVIRHNAYLVEESSKAIEANRRLLEAAGA